MQTKSWQIALVGLLPLVISNIAYVYSLITAPCQEADCTLSLFLPLIMLGFLDLFAAAIILFLRSEDRKNIGIALSLASGFFIMGLYAAYSSNIGAVPTVILVVWPVFFLTFAGVYCFLKKV
jgi:lipopolysaccharide export LptBFGC system permease protein LptF